MGISGGRGGVVHRTIEVAAEAGPEPDRVCQEVRRPWVHAACPAGFAV